MPTYIEMEKRTPYTILRTKYLDHIEKNGILPTLKTTATALASMIVGIWWAYPDTIIDLFWSIFGVGNFLILKILVVAFLFFGSPAIFDSIMDEVSEKIKKDSGEKIGGVDVAEIVNYIFEHGDFARSEVIETFAISRSQYMEIINVLDKNNIFIRGENNGRVLNEKLTRQMIVEILLGKDTEKKAEIMGEKFDFLDDLKNKISPLFKQKRFTRRKI